MAAIGFVFPVTDGFLVKIHGDCLQIRWRQLGQCFGIPFVILMIQFQCAGESHKLSDGMDAGKMLRSLPLRGAPDSYNEIMIWKTAGRSRCIRPSIVIVTLGQGVVFGSFDPFSVCSQPMGQIVIIPAIGEEMGNPFLQ